MKKYKITVETENGQEVISGDRFIVGEVKDEIRGLKFHIQEYITDSGNVICDADILCIAKIEPYKTRFEI